MSDSSVDELFQSLEKILFQTWQETGFGHVEIDSERINQNKIRVIIRGSTHYRFVISNEDLEKWQITGGIGAFNSSTSSLSDLMLHS